MQTSHLRYCLLIGVLLAGAVAYAALGEPLGFGTPRWPQNDDVYVVQPWTIVAHKTEQVMTADFVTRVYRHPGGATATLTLVTHQAAKLYAAGAEVPFLGSGYSVHAAPGDLVPVEREGVHALVAQRGAEQWLVLYAFGERRGLLGNGPLAWSLALFDGLAGRPNDYYKLYLASRADTLDPSLGQGMAGLASTVFGRVATWYAT